MDAYSFTTVTVEPDGTAKVVVSMHPDEDMRIHCTSGRDRAQISVMHARADVTISPTDATAPTAGDVQAARRLATAFATYAAEVERLHSRTALDGDSAESGGERAA